MTRRGADFPWWLVVLAGLVGLAFWLVALDPVQRQTLGILVRGLRITVLVTLVGFAGAAALGLALALASLSGQVWLRQIARLYIEIMRGVPVIVILLYTSFALVPALIAGWNALAEPLGLSQLRTRDFPVIWRAVMALVMTYGAFLSEVFRAGLQSVPRSQTEAALALGLSRWRRFRLVSLPQALRTILPPLGNDFVAMVKDSSLVSVLGVADVTQMGKVTAVANFRYFETYNLVALIYLTLTVSLSLALGALERRLRARGAPERTS